MVEYLDPTNRLPQKVTFHSDGTYPAWDPQTRSVMRREFPKPWNQPHTLASYQVHETRDLNGEAFPARFVLELYARVENASGPDDLYTYWTLNGQVEEVHSTVAFSSRLDILPRFVGSCFFVDGRVRSVDNIAPSYVAEAWFRDGSPELRILSETFATQYRKRQHIKTGFTFLILGLVLAPLFMLLSKQYRQRKLPH